MWDITHYNNDKEFDVILYETINGKIPFIDFMDSIENRMQAKVHKAIGILRRDGSKLRYPLSRKISDGIFELRVMERNNISRIFYFFYYDKKIVILNGYVKKSNRISNYELEKAIKYKVDWIRRNEK